MLHYFESNVSLRCGVKAAVIAEGIYLARSYGIRRRDFQGRRWVCFGMKEMQLAYPYLTLREIEGAIRKLIHDGILVKRRDLNENPFNRTNWYAVTEYGEALLNGEAE